VTVYAWPGWGVNAFELRVLPNLRTFVGPYTPTTQVIDLLGERWVARIDLAPTTDPIQIAAWEAFFDRLKGQLNQTSFGHLKVTVPQGTIRGGTAATVVNASIVTVSVVNASLAAVTVMAGVPAIRGAVAQLANTATVCSLAGKTVRAGDPLGINGQLVRVMADATADASGNLAIEFQPRARAIWPYGTPVVWSAPTANFMLKTSDGVPTTWVPGMADGPSIEFVEVP
jgi:hypothetical protein